MLEELQVPTIPAIAGGALEGGTEVSSALERSKGFTTYSILSCSWEALQWHVWVSALQHSRLLLSLKPPTIGMFGSGTAIKTTFEGAAATSFGCKSPV